MIEPLKDLVIIFLYLIWDNKSCSIWKAKYELQQKKLCRRYTFTIFKNRPKSKSSETPEETLI